MIEPSIQFLSCPPPILRSPCGGLLRRQLHALPDAEEENQESAPVTPGGALTDRSLPARTPKVKRNGEIGSLPENPTEPTSK